MLSYELLHSDGRRSFPLVLINWAPTSSEIGLLTLHASALLDFQSTVSDVILFLDVFSGGTFLRPMRTKSSKSGTAQRVSPRKLSMRSSADSHSRQINVDPVLRPIPVMAN